MNDLNDVSPLLGVGEFSSEMEFLAMLTSPSLCPLPPGLRHMAFTLFPLSTSHISKFFLFLLQA